VTSPAAVTVYESTVTAVGELMPTMVAEGVIILFGQDAPEELHDFAVLHEPTLTGDAPAPGDTITIGEQSWTVLAVGEVVKDNLLNLGHLDLKANGETTAALPGDVCVTSGPVEVPAIGDVVRILRRQ
jgi:PTS system glucitol/sorbitol-specific IIA component